MCKPNPTKIEIPYLPHSSTKKLLKMSPLQSAQGVIIATKTTKQVDVYIGSNLWWLQ